MDAEKKTRAEHFDQDIEDSIEGGSHPLGLVLIIELKRHARPNLINWEDGYLVNDYLWYFLIYLRIKLIMAIIIIIIEQLWGPF